MIKLPEPDTHCEDLDTWKEVWSYSKELLQQAILGALEEAAKVCDDLSAKALAAQIGNPDSLPNVMLRQVAIMGHGQSSEAIRKLKEDIQ